MITSKDFMEYLQSAFPSAKFYNGAINKKDERCVGVYPRGNVAPIKMLGGASNTSYAALPIRLLIHWSTNTDECQTMANAIYENLYAAEGVSLGGKRLIMIQLLDESPVDLFRDENNFAEMAIRMNLYYER